MGLSKGEQGIAEDFPIPNLVGFFYKVYVLFKVYFFHDSNTI